MSVMVRAHSFMRWARQKTLTGRHFSEGQPKDAGRSWALTSTATGKGTVCGVRLICLD